MTICVADYTSMLDARLKSLARHHKCRYTRYADDITFSCVSDVFPSPIAEDNGATWEVGKALRTAITVEGFTINAAKTSMRLAGSRQVVTGLVVNRGVNV